MPDSEDKLVIIGLLVLGPSRVDRMAETLGWRNRRVLAAVEKLGEQGRVVKTKGCCSEPEHDTYGLIHGADQRDPLVPAALQAGSQLSGGTVRP